MALPTVLRRAFLAAAILWTLALPLATWAASRPHASALPYAFAFTVYGLGSFVCHQRPERSFFLWGAKMPVCARCAGIYLGGAVAAIGSAFLVLGSRFGSGFKVLGAYRQQQIALVLSVVPTAATLAYEWSTGHMPAGWVRALAGAPMGAVVAWIVMTATLPEVN